jgi:hypothetical protein
MGPPLKYQPTHWMPLPEPPRDSKSGDRPPTTI